MDDKEKALELMLAHLMGNPVNTGDIQSVIVQIATESETQALFEKLESLLSWQDDPEWLEAIAAAREGVIIPEVADFLNDREALAQLAPDLVTHFETLSMPAPEDGEILPAGPTFAEQFKAQQKQALSLKSTQDEATDWNKAFGVKWRHIKEQGQTVIKILTEALSPSAGGQLAYAGIRRGRRDQFRFELQEELEDLHVTITVRVKPNKPDYCTVTVKADIPSRGGWPNLDNTEVTLKRGDIDPRTELTDAYGESVFEEISWAELPDFVIEVTPPT